MNSQTTTVWMYKTHGPMVNNGRSVTNLNWLIIFRRISEPSTDTGGLGDTVDTVDTVDT